MMSPQENVNLLNKQLERIWQNKYNQLVKGRSAKTDKTVKTSPTYFNSTKGHQTRITKQQSGGERYNYMIIKCSERYNYTIIKSSCGKWLTFDHILKNCQRLDHERKSFREYLIDNDIPALPEGVLNLH